MNMRVGGFTAILSVALLPAVAAAQGMPAPTDVVVELALAERVAIEAGVVLLMGVAVVGIMPYWGSPAIETTRGSVIVSTLFGAIGAFMLVLLGGSAWIFSQVMLGWLVAYPMALGILAIVFFARAVGFIALGDAIVARLGIENDWVGLLVGVVIAAMLAVIPIAGTAIATVITLTGMGGVIRMAIGSDHKSKREQRMPPAHQL